MNGVQPPDQAAAAGGVVVARVRRVLTGHSERSLIHAVDPDSLEYKLEVPSDVLRNLVPGQEHALMLSWTLQPVAAPPTSSAGTSLRSPRRLQVCRPRCRARSTKSSWPSWPADAARRPPANPRRVQARRGVTARRSRRPPSSSPSDWASGPIARRADPHHHERCSILALQARGGNLVCPKKKKEMKRWRTENW
jgi:hypothetical protein